MTLAQRIEKAFRSPELAKALRALVLDLAQEGLSKADIRRVFEQFLLESAACEGPFATREDTLRDVMAELTGH